MFFLWLPQNSDILSRLGILRDSSQSYRLCHKHVGCSIYSGCHIIFIDSQIVAFDIVFVPFRQGLQRACFPVQFRKGILIRVRIKYYISFATAETLPRLLSRLLILIHHGDEILVTSSITIVLIS